MHLPQSRPPLTASGRGQAPLAEGWARWLRRPIIHLPLLMAALLLHVASGLFHLHPPIGWVDPGLYIYWFMNPAENALHRGTDYHSARLSFILPGFVLYRLFEPVTAQALLVLGFYALGLAAIYTIAATLLRSAALRCLAVFVVGVNPLWIAAFTRGYVDGPSMAFGLATIACLARPGAGIRLYALAGSLLMLAVCAHPFGGAVAGMAALGVGLVGLGAPGRWLRHGLAALAGALACLLALMASGVAIGLPLLFFAAIPGAISRSVHGTYDLFSLGILDWLPDAPRLILIPAILLMLAMGMRQALRDGRPGLALVAAAMLPLVPLAAWLFRSAALLQYAFYASYLMLSAVPAVILLLRRIEMEPRPVGRIAVPALCLGILALSAGGAFLPMASRMAWPMAGLGWAAATLGLVVAMAFAWRAGPRPAAAALALTLSLAGSLNADTMRVFRLADGADHAAQHAAMARLHTMLRAQAALQGPYRTWISRDRFTLQNGLAPRDIHVLSFAGSQMHLNALDSLVASLGWHRSAIGFTMPHAERDPWTLYQLTIFAAEAERFIALCGDPHDCTDGLNALRELGITVTPGEAVELRVPGVPRVHIQLAHITSPPPLDDPGREQMRAILARLERADAAGENAPRNPQDRATWRDPSALSGEPSVPDVLSVACRDEGAARACLVAYQAAGSAPGQREFLFQRLGNFHRLYAASERAR